MTFVEGDLVTISDSYASHEHGMHTLLYFIGSIGKVVEVANDTIHVRLMSIMPITYKIKDQTSHSAYTFQMSLVTAQKHLKLVQILDSREERTSQVESKYKL